MTGWTGGGPRVRGIGEFELIARLRDALPPSVRGAASLPIGIGDDAAVWTPTAGERIVVTTDALVDGVHFRQDWTDPKRLGHKILAVNLSDLAAMGAQPRLAVVTLALTGDEPLQALIDLYRGMGALARRTGTAVAGGDVVRSPFGLAFNVTAIGESRGGRVLTRDGARPGDLLGCTGTLGASAAGLRLLAEASGSPRRRAAVADHLIEAHLRPEPRLALGALLVAEGATAAMDLSDGLLGDLPKLLSASGVSVRVDARRIPVAAAVRALFPDDWLELALRGGEDYELLFAAPPAAFRAIEEAAARQGATVGEIGALLPAGDAPEIALIDLDGNARRVRAGAFDHFSPPA